MRDILTYVAVHYWFWLLLGAFIVFCFLAIFITATLEKYPIRQYQPGSPGEVCPPSAYFLAMNEAAQNFGFRHCGNFLQSRGSSLYRCCISLWLSPDQRSLVIVGGGKLAKIDYKRTFFLSVAEDGKEILTVDDFGLSDLSHFREIDTVYHASLEELNSRHMARLAIWPAPLREFSPARCLEQYEDLGKVRAETMVLLGLAKFIDPSESAYRHTLKGAWLKAYQGYIKGLENANLQKERQKIKRPGS
jgi:hypothetical protein